MKKKWLLIGTLTKAQGLKGEIRMSYLGNSPDELDGLKSVRVTKSNGEEIELEILRVRKGNSFLILKFKDIDSIEDVECLASASVYADRADLKELEESEYYYDDLIGIAVYDESGELIGNVESIFETGSNDVYVVKRGSKELLIPAIADVIKEVDIGNKVMRVHLLEGMKDDF